MRGTVAWATVSGRNLVRERTASTSAFPALLNFGSRKRLEMLTVARETCAQENMEAMHQASAYVPRFSTTEQNKGMRRRYEPAQTGDGENSLTAKASIEEGGKPFGLFAARPRWTLQYWS